MINAQQIAQKAKAVMDPELNKGPPADVIIPPFKEHKQTFVLLHGKGDQARHFGTGLLSSQIPDYGTLQDCFPHAKFVFPQAPIRSCTRQKGWRLHQWFDNWGYDASGRDKEDLKIEGLRATTMMVHNLLEQEIELVGAENIVLGGLSQGCAASHVALLTWQGSPLAGCFLMCGHLPFRESIEIAAQDQELDTKITPGKKAHLWLRQKLDLAGSVADSADEASFTATPIFIGHGDRDGVVPTRLGREAAKCIGTLTAQSKYHEYKGLTHWYNDDMLRDFVEFLTSRTQWTTIEE